MHFIDTHAHLFYENKLSDVGSILRSAKENGVEQIIFVSYDIVSSRLAVQTAEAYPEIYAAIGIHPDEISLGREPKFSDVLSLMEEFKGHPKVVAIGEIGLEYHYLKGTLAEQEKEKESQKKLMRAQMNFAAANNLPVIFHCRDAEDDFFALLQEESFSKEKGVLHCFYGTQKQAKQAEKLGLFIGLGGSITYPKNAGNSEFIRMIQSLPKNKILLETDCPYLAPVPLRGSTNEPKNIRIIAEKLAGILNVQLEKIGEMTTENAANLFQRMK